MPELSNEFQVSEERPQQAGVLNGNQPRLERDAEALLLNVHLSAQHRKMLKQHQSSGVPSGRAAIADICECSWGSHGEPAHYANGQTNHLHNLSPHGLVGCEVAARVCDEGAGELRQPCPAGNVAEEANEACILSQADDT